MISCSGIRQCKSVLLLGAQRAPVARTLVLAGSFAPCSQNGKFGGWLARVVGSERGARFPHGRPLRQDKHGAGARAAASGTAAAAAAAAAAEPFGANFLC